MGNPDLLRATKVLTAMEDALAKAPPTTPASLLQYWTQVRDRAADYEYERRRDELMERAR